MHLATQNLESPTDELDCLLVLSGEIDMASAPRIACTAVQAVCLSPANRVTVDLSRASWSP
jgi:hypothetical protein